MNSSCVLRIAVDSDFNILSAVLVTGVVPACTFRLRQNGKLPNASSQDTRSSPAGEGARSLKVDDAPPLAASASPPQGVQPARVSNQSAEARTAIIATIALYGIRLMPFRQEQRKALTAVLSATIVATANVQLTRMELLSVSEYMPTNTTSSPPPSRRLLPMRKLSGTSAALHLSGCKP